MSMSGELYLLLAIVATTAFALVLAYYAAQQARIDRARKAAGGRANAGSDAHGVPTHA